MRLSEYLDREGAPTMAELAARSGISYHTIKAVAKGMKLNRYDKAVALSNATRPSPSESPLVTVEELCEVK